MANKAYVVINRQYQLSEPSDEVVFFPTGENGVYVSKAFNGAKILGDVVISLEKAREQATELGHGINEEVAFLCVHSTLHLLGYDHETSPEDEEDMFSRQREIMKKFRKQDDK